MEEVTAGIYLVRYNTSVKENQKHKRNLRRSVELSPTNHRPACELAQSVALAKCSWRAFCVSASRHLF